MCQRPRCWYFRNGMGLLATTKDGKSMMVAGDNRYGAILGNDGPAYFVSPSTIAPALIAYGAKIRHLLGEGLRQRRARTAAGEVLHHSELGRPARARPEARRDGDRVDRSASAEEFEGLELRSAAEALRSTGRSRWPVSRWRWTATPSRARAWCWATSRRLRGSRPKQSKR